MKLDFAETKYEVCKKKVEYKDPTLANYHGAISRFCDKHNLGGWNNKCGISKTAFEFQQFTDHMRTISAKEDNKTIS